MKFFLLFSALLALSSTENSIVNYVGIDFANLQFDLDEKLVESFLKKYDQAKLTRSAFDTVAVINEYADKIFANIETYSLSHGLDPTQITDVNDKFLTASITLTKGLLHGVSTISRSKNNVAVEYISNGKEMILQVPVEFTNLEFTYDYHLIILLIGPSGSLTGKIKDLEMNILVAFDFTNYHARVIQVETTNAGSGEITAVVNEYADKVFHNIQKLILRGGLDPIKLPDEVLKLLPTGTISISKGWLQDTSTIERYKDVSVSYSSSTKTMIFAIPIQFKDLMFTYEYNTKVLLLNVSGDIQGKVTNVRANIKFSFNFGRYEAYLDTFDIKDTGTISVSFSGNGLFDWITNSMTRVVSFFLHPIIIGIVEFIVKGGLEIALTTINEAIDDFLHNKTLSVDSYLA